MSKAHRGGTLADIGCHILDLVRYAAGEFRTLSCRMKSFDKGVRGNRWKGYSLDADDSFVATVEIEGGALGVVHATRWATGYRNSLRIRLFGDKGGILFDTDDGWERLKVCVDPFHTHRAIWNTVDAPGPRVTIQARFIRSIRSGRPEPPTFEDGLRSQAILDACARSAQESRPLRVRS
jgi:predicted dehydrogenase